MKDSKEGQEAEEANHALLNGEVVLNAGAVAQKKQVAIFILLAFLETAAQAILLRLKDVFEPSIFLEQLSVHVHEVVIFAIVFVFNLLSFLLSDLLEALIQISVVN